MFSFEDKANIMEICGLLPDVKKEKIEEIYVMNNHNLEKSIDAVLNLSPEELLLHRKMTKIEESIELKK